MIAVKSRISGWKIVYLSAAIIGTIFLIILFFNGINEANIRLIIRATARISCILFVLIFIASSLHKIRSSKISKWLLKNRRYLGVSVAVSHIYHTIAIIGLLVMTSGKAYNFDPAGHIGYIILIAMTVTSFERTAALIGKTVWKRLHGVGIYYLWFYFTYLFYLGLEESISIYLPFVLLLVLAMIIRLTNIIMTNKLRSRGEKKNVSETKKT